MVTKARDSWAAGLAFAMLVVGAFGPARADEESSVADTKADEAALRKKALGLNDFTGGDPLRGADMRSNSE